MSELKTRAYIKGVDLAPRKVKIVADLVRNRTVEDALVILKHTPRRAATVVKKAVESAKANLLNKGSIDTKSIFIETISVTAGSRYKRYVPASRGRALPFQKVSSNITVVVMGNEKAKKAVATGKTEKAAEAKKDGAKAGKETK